MKPQGHLSNVARRRKWKNKKRPPKKKLKNFLYYSDIIDVSENNPIEPGMGETVNGCEYVFDDIDCLNVGTDNMSDFNVIKMTTLKGWALPLRNDLEDTSSYVACPDPIMYNLESDDCKIYLQDIIAFDQVVQKEKDKKELEYKDVKRFHRAHWHANGEQLRKWLVKRSWNDDRKKKTKHLIKKVMKNCRGCKGKKQVHGRPREIGLRAEYPNEIVVVDQAFMKDDETKSKYPFLHLMDVATRWSLAFTITGRGGNAGGYDVTKALFLWEQIWGSPPQILFSDRGREFINSRVYEYCIQRDIKQLTSPVKTPASNGLIERHNGILKNIAYKLADLHRQNLERNYVDFEDILFSAAAAKNSMVGKLGYSSQYLAFLNNHLCFAEMSTERSIPSISSDLEPTKLEVEKQVTCRLKLRNDALRIVHERLRDEELEKILRQRSRPVPDQIPDDAIVDWHDETGTSRGWNGPCKVIRQETKMVWIETPSGDMKKVHRHRIRPRMYDGKIEMEVVQVDEKVVEDVQKEDPKDEEPDFNTMYKKESVSAFKHQERDYDDDFTPYEPNKGSTGEEEEEEIVDSSKRCISVDRESEEAKIKDEQPEQTGIKRKRGRPKGKAKSVTEVKGIPKRKGRPPKSQITDLKSISEILEKHVNKEKAEPVRTGKHELSRILKDKRLDDITPVGSGVLTRNQKKKLMNMFIVDHTSTDKSHDIFVTKDDLKLKECVDGPEFDQPKIDEWAAWQRNDSFEWVKDTGQPKVNCRWVLTKRRVFTKQQLVKLLKKEIKLEDIPVVVKIKARLTPQGTVKQDPDRENIECESPTADKISIRSLLSLAAIEDWDIETFDVSEAFLQQLPMADLEGIMKSDINPQKDTIPLYSNVVSEPFSGFTLKWSQYFCNVLLKTLSATSNPSSSCKHITPCNTVSLVMLTVDCRKIWLDHHYCF